MSQGEPKVYRSVSGDTRPVDAAPTHTMYYGMALPLSAEEKKNVKFDEKQEQEAIDDVRNISEAEVARRFKFSQYAMLISVLGSLLFVYKDNELPRYARGVMLLPYSAAISMYISASTGV